MARKTQERREALKEQLLDIAEKRVAEAGLSALRARDLAREANCAVGAIYNVFDDLTGLTLAVNLRTFQKLGVVVGGAVEAVADAPPTDRLVTMSMAYLRFASDHPNLWRSLFDVRMSADQNVPDWYIEELGRLFAFIAAPLAEVYPDKSAAEIDLMTRALFSSVHGIVLLGLERRISGVPLDHIGEQIDFVLRSATHT